MTIYSFLYYLSIAIAVISWIFFFRKKVLNKKKKNNMDIK
jgi:hypothetical protein